MLEQGPPGLSQGAGSGTGQSYDALSRQGTGGDLHE